MKRLILAALLLVAPKLWAQGTLSPTNPVVVQGNSVTINCTANCGTGGTWSFPNGGLGTLTNQTSTSVTYTAPAMVTPQQTLGGYQLLPNDHVYNTNIASLGVHANSVHWMTDGTTVPPAAPSISCSNSGGSLATNTIFVKVTYKWNFGAGLPVGETAGSAEVSCSVTGPSGSVTVTAPTIPSNISGYTVYDSTTTGTELQQAASPNCVMITTNCVITTLAAGSAVPSSFQGVAGVIPESPSGLPSYFPGFAVNYLPLPGQISETMNFTYTSANNGTFISPQFPNALLESGWFSARANDAPDHHFITFNTATGDSVDRYQYYCGNLATTAASLTSNVITLTFGSSPATCGLANGQSICIGSFSGADTYFNVCPATITALGATTIQYALTHANGTASTNGFVTSQAAVGSACRTAGTCTSQSGVLYGNTSYAQPSATTDAAGLFLMPLTLRIQELEQAIATSGTINHAIRITFAPGIECTCNVWPSTTVASNGNYLPWGIRLRLRPPANFPINGFSAGAQILLKQLNQYGALNADGGNHWQMSQESGPFSQTIENYLTEMAGATKNFTITNTALTNNVATITATNDLQPGYIFDISGTSNGSGAFNGVNFTVLTATGSSFTFILTHANVGSAADSGTAKAHLGDYFDVIDESSLMVSSSTGATTTGEVVSFTSSTGTVNTNIALQGAAVGFTNDVLYFMAGTPAYQLPVKATNTSYTCTMSPSVGSLTSGCLYTAPATQSSATSITVTATSTTNAAVASQMTVWIFPQTGIYILQCSTNTFGCDANSNFTDSFSRVWKGGWGLGVNNLAQIQGCCQNNSGFANITDKQLWWNHFTSSGTQGDYHSDAFRVPQGSYLVTYYMDSRGSTLDAPTRYFYLQGNLIATQNPNTVAGGNDLPYMLQSCAQVGSDNKLAFINTGQGHQSFSSADISALSIVPGGCGSGTQRGHLP